MKQLSSDRMGQAPLLPLILSMSFPVMFSLLIQTLYNVADSFFVARTSGHALTAVSLALPVQTLITAIASGTGVGVNALIARALGAKNNSEAASVAAHGLTLGAASWVVFSLLCLPLLGIYFNAFTSTPEVVVMGRQYTGIVVLFSLGLFVENISTKILQAQGNMTLPMVFQTCGALLNVVLDPILIFGMGPVPALGVSGAAYATVAAQLCVMVCSLAAVLRPGREVHVTWRGLRFCPKTVRQIYLVGLPDILKQALYTFYIAGLNGILSTFSDAAVTVLGIYYKIQGFITMPILGLSQGMLPILSYNYGARLYPRMLRALRHSCVLAFCTLLAGTALFWVFPAQLLGIFSPTEEMLTIGVPALRIVSLSFPLFPFTLLTPMLLQVTGHGNKSIAITLLRQVVLLVPLAYAFSRFGLSYLWFTFPVSEVVATALSCWLTLRLTRESLALPDTL